MIITVQQAAGPANNNILLCSDLDRTILPNGRRKESPGTRALFRTLCARPEMKIAYVSGRHKALLLEAIEKYDIPTPDYAISDVGATIYEIDKGAWRLKDAWRQKIASDWRGITGDRLAALFADIDILRLQEPSKQRTFKLSYYVPPHTEMAGLSETMHRLLQAEGIQANLIWSIDELKDIGLLDVLPASAGKLHAIRFLMQQHGFAESRTVFAGDSGNDMQVLTSGLQAVLVRNADTNVRQEARRRLTATSRRQNLYFAHGDFRGMNGNYAAGVLEGLVHFIPETAGYF